MEVVLDNVDGAPANAILSIKCGDVRRQFPISKVGQPFRFSHAPSAPLPLKVDMFVPFAQTQEVIIDPASDNLQVSFQPQGGRPVTASLKHRDAPELRTKTPPIAKLTESESMTENASYMEKHDLVRVFQDIIHGLLVNKPDDPHEQIKEHVNREKVYASTRPKVQAPKPEKAPEPPEAQPPINLNRQVSGNATALLQMLQSGKKNMELLIPYLVDTPVYDFITQDDFTKNCKEDFRSLDTDNSGELDVKECLPLVEALSEKMNIPAFNHMDPEHFINFFDADRNGVLSEDEFCEFVLFLVVMDYMETPEGKEMFEIAKKNDTKSFEKFVALLQDDVENVWQAIHFMPMEEQEYLMSSEFEKQCLQSFSDLDVDGSGALEPMEVLPIIQELTHASPFTIDLEKCTQFVKIFDVRGNGVITKEEFTLMCQYLFSISYFAGASEPPSPSLDPSEPHNEVHDSMLKQSRRKVDALLKQVKKGKTSLSLMMAFLPEGLVADICSEEFQKGCNQEFNQLDVEKKGELGATELIPTILELLQEKFQSTAQSVSTDQAEEFVLLFDTDKNGVITRDEFLALVQFFVVADYIENNPEAMEAVDKEQGERHFEQMLRMLEEDRSHLEDFFSLLPDWLASVLESAEFIAQCGEEFKLLDADNSGVLEPPELLPVISACASKFGEDGHKIDIDLDKCERFVKVFDVYGDGVIRKDEFVLFSQFIIITSYLDEIRASSEAARSESDMMSEHKTKMNRSKVDGLLDMIHYGKSNLKAVLPYVPEELRKELTSEAFEQECLENFQELDVENTGRLGPQEIGPMIVNISGARQNQITLDQALEFIYLFDKDQNGTIEADEFYELVQMVCISYFLRSEEGKVVVNMAQEEQDDSDRFEYFLAMLEKDAASLSAIIPFLPADFGEYLKSDEFWNSCMRNFDELDVDSSGALEPLELIPVIESLSEGTIVSISKERCERFVKVFDCRGDGVIRRDEFVNFVMFLQVANYVAEQQASMSLPGIAEQAAVVSSFSPTSPMTTEADFYKTQAEKLMLENEALKEKTKRMEVEIELERKNREAADLQAKVQQLEATLRSTA
jgi:Ca2+-binding EF-hand superfamily protein